MVTVDDVKELIRSFPEVTEAPHFEKLSFRVNKKILATLTPDGKLLTVKLSLIDQSAFSSFDKLIIYPVPNKWGAQGWTQINLEKIRKAMLKDAVTAAYCEVAPSRLSAPFREKYKRL